MARCDIVGVARDEPSQIDDLATARRAHESSIPTPHCLESRGLSTRAARVRFVPPFSPKWNGSFRLRAATAGLCSGTSAATGTAKPAGGEGDLNDRNPRQSLNSAHE